MTVSDQTSYLFNDQRSVRMIRISCCPWKAIRISWRLTMAFIFSLNSSKSFTSAGKIHVVAWTNHRNSWYTQFKTRNVALPMGKERPFSIINLMINHCIKFINLLSWAMVNANHHWPWWLSEGTCWARDPDFSLQVLFTSIAGPESGPTVQLGGVNPYE